MTPLGSQAAKEEEIMSPTSKNQRTSHTITPSQGAVVDAFSLKEVCLDEEVEQAPLRMKQLFEMMWGMQQNQANLAQAIQRIEESNKARDKENPRQEELAPEKDQNEKVADNGEKTRQDKANGVLDSNNDPQYVTLADLAKLIEREQAKISKVPRQFVRQPPYPSELLHKPYP